MKSLPSVTTRLVPALPPELAALLPPALVVILMQKWFVKGLVDTEK